jgi:hypothetical protein
MAVFYEPPERGWTKIPDELIDMDMSFAAIGVLMHMLKNRADWEEPIWRIAQKMNKGKHQVTAAVKELQKHGFARQTERKIGGNLSTKGWDFAWPAFTEEIPRSARDTGFRDPEGRDAGHRDAEVRDTGFRGPGGRGVENRGLLEDSVDQDRANETSVDQDITEEYKRAKPDPAPEEVPVALLNLNDFEDLPTGPAKLPRQRKSTPTDDPDFDKAWATYGHKVDRVQAKKAWARAVKKAPAETILAAIPAYVAVTTGKGEPEGTGTAWKPRRKNLATWLNNEGWTEEIEPPKKGYQGQAGSDLGPAESYENAAKHLPIHRLARLGPMGNDWEMNFAWYYHWNVQEQRGWTVEQMLETGNTPEDVDALMDAYVNGIDPQLYRRLLDDYNIPPHGSDA